MTSVSGQSNSYPAGQCTQYASERYHALSGFYVPWAGNAKDWAGQAAAYGWMNSSTPVVPSIICLQAGIQLADGTYGHVGVVEGISKGNVETTDLNWGVTSAERTTPHEVTFIAPAPGVSFIYAVDANNKPVGASSSPSASSAVQTLSNLVTGSSTVSLTPNSDVTDLLVTFDDLLNLNNPFDVQNVQTVSIFGGTIDDPFSWIEGFGGNIIADLTALALRGIFFFFGLVLIYKMIDQFFDVSALVDTAVSGVKTAASVAAL